MSNANTGERTHHRRTHPIAVSHNITVTLTGEEYALLESRARHYDLDVDEYISRRLLFKRIPRDKALLFSTLARVLISISKRLDSCTENRPASFAKEINQLKQLLSKFGQHLEPHLNDCGLEDES